VPIVLGVYGNVDNFRKTIKVMFDFSFRNSHFLFGSFTLPLLAVWITKGILKIIF